MLSCVDPETVPPALLCAELLVFGVSYCASAKMNESRQIAPQVLLFATQAHVLYLPETA